MERLDPARVTRSLPTRLVSLRRPPRTGPTTGTPPVARIGARDHFAAPFVVEVRAVLDRARPEMAGPRPPASPPRATPTAAPAVPRSGRVPWKGTARGHLVIHIPATASGPLLFRLLTVAAPPLVRPRGDHPTPWRALPPDVMGVPGNACPRARRQAGWATVCEAGACRRRPGAGGERGGATGGLGSGGGEPGRERRPADPGAGNRAAESGERRGVREDRWRRKAGTGLTGGRVAVVPSVRGRGAGEPGVDIGPEVLARPAGEYLADGVVPRRGARSAPACRARAGRREPIARAAIRAAPNRVVRHLPATRGDQREERGEPVLVVVLSGVPPSPGAEPARRVVISRVQKSAMAATPTARRTHCRETNGTY